MASILLEQYKTRDSNVWTESNSRTSSSILCLALSARAPESLIQELIGRAPGLAKVHNQGRNFPLHLAIQYGASYYTVRLLLSIFPDAARASNSDRQLPLHIVISHTNAERLPRQRTAFPDNMMARSSSDHSPLVSALNKLRAEVLCAVCAKYPEAVFIADSEGTSPVTDLLRRNQMSSVLNCFPDTSSHAILVRDDCNNNLIHTVMSAELLEWDMCYEIRDVTILLLSVVPQLARQDNYNGNRPLHLACGFEWNLPLRAAPRVQQPIQMIVHKLIDADPESLDVYNDLGYLPFHIVFCNKALDFKFLRPLIPVGLSGDLPVTRDHMQSLFLASDCDASMNAVFECVQLSLNLFK